MRKITGAFLIFILSLILLNYLVIPAYADENQINTDIIERGKVLSLVRNILKPTEDYPFPGQILKIEVTSGKYAGEIFEVYNIFSDNPTYNVNVKPGQGVILTIDEEEGQLKAVNISDVVRDFPLLLLGILFCLFLIILGGIQGIKSLTSLIFTIALIFLVLLPLLLKGYDPILITISLSAIITAVTLFLVGGWKRKSLAAFLGIVAGTTFAGILALAFGHLAHLTGFGSKEAQMLGFIRNYQLDFKGILFASMLFGALGAIMDVGMSIASAIEEVYAANPIATPRELFTAGMNVGRDIMGTMSNTLILAYTGGSLPLLLILVGYQPSFLKVINLDLIASEIIRALTGSLGLFVAIPLTALFSAWLIHREIMKKFYC